MYIKNVKSAESRISTLTIQTVFLEAVIVYSALVLIFLICSNCIDSGLPTGRDVIMQSIREICILQDSVATWWQFQNDMARCNRTCADELYPKYNISVDDINTCVDRSFLDDSAIDDNSLLRTEVQSNGNITSAPSLYIEQGFCPVKI